MKAFSQYLMRDDGKRFGQGKRSATAGFETGLRHANGQEKPAYTAFMLPLRVSEAGDSHVLWGRVRPATEPVDVTIQRDTGDGWKRLTTHAHRRRRRVRPGHAGARRRALPRALDAGGRGDLHRAAHPPVLSTAGYGRCPSTASAARAAPPAARTSARAAASRAAIARVARDRLGVGADRRRVLRAR